MGKNILELAVAEALHEARILECAYDKYDEENVKRTAVRLSGAPAVFVEMIFNQTFRRTI